MYRAHKEAAETNGRKPRVEDDEKRLNLFRGVLAPDCCVIGSLPRWIELCSRRTGRGSDNSIGPHFFSTDHVVCPRLPKHAKQMVGLKYCSATMRCDEVVDGEGGASAPPAELICSLGELSAEPSSESSSAGAGEGEAAATQKPAGSGRPKGNISWVSTEEAVRAEVRLYSHLFTVDSPDDKWEEQVCASGPFYLFSSYLWVFFVEFVFVFHPLLFVQFVSCYK